MIKTFSYPMPDELYINSFDEGKEISLTYDGPKYINVLVHTPTGIINGINPEHYDVDSCSLIKINAEQQPEICYYLTNLLENHEYEYEEEIMENGDIYQKIKNPTLLDCYDAVYDSELKSIKLNVIAKNNLDNYVTLNLTAIRNRLGFILSNEEGKKEKGEDQDVSLDLLDQISEVVKDIDKYIEENPYFMSWKYTNFDNVLESVFPIPEKIQDLLKNYQ
jgi:hypothetical protein